MKRKALLLLIFPLILSGCIIQKSGGEENQIFITENTTDILLDEVIQANTETSATKEKPPVNIEQTDAIKTEQIIEQATIVREKNHDVETTIAESVTSSEKETTAPVTVIAESTPELVVDDKESAITIYKDTKSKKEYILLSIIPQNIYWNKIDGYALNVGQAVTIFLPAIFLDLVNQADELLIHFKSDKTEHINLETNDIIISNGIKYPQYWDIDYLCPIKDGVLHFYPYTEEIKNTFSRIDDGVYLEEANYYYPENPFKDGMTISELDLYFTQLYIDYLELQKEIADNPDTAYEIAGFWGYQTGVRFRAKIDQIY